MKLSIIIPALEEAETLGKTLQGIKGGAAEVIVVDGGSKDDTVEVARQYTPHVLISRKSRGLQQHTGARQSSGDVLVFVHADTQLPHGYQRRISRALADPAVIFGAFYLSIYPSSPALDLVACTANLRSRLLQLPYGDQALFVRRQSYFQAGGFNDWPVMEDVDLVRRLNRLGSFKLARGQAKTSARRWHKENLVRTTLRNWSLIARYLLGVSPENLARRYPDAR